MGWDTSGIVTDGLNKSILADTGALAAGIYPFKVLAWADVSLYIDIVLRDALNTADIAFQRMLLENGKLNQVDLPITISILNQRIIVRSASPYSGNVQVSILK